MEADFLLLKGKVQALWDVCLLWPLGSRHIQRQTFIGRLTFLATNSPSAFGEVCRRTLCVPWQVVCGETLQDYGRPGLGHRVSV